MLKPDVFDIEHNLMITVSDNPKKKLHKIGTDAYYSSAIDVILGYKEVDGKKVPFSLYTYEEVNKTEEELKLEERIKEEEGGKE